MNGLMDFLQQTSRTAGQTATGLVDLAALALRPLGYSIPDEKVFGTTKWAEKKGLLAPESQTPAGLAGQTVGNLLFPLGAGKSTQIADGLLTAQANAAAPRVLRKESGMFIGPGAKTWDAQAAKKAQTMAAKGVDPKTIWNETGTFKGPDGMWRQEIDDSGAKLLENTKAREYMAGPGPAEYPVGAVSNVLEHPSLGAAYPDAMAIKARLVKGESGAYIPNTGFGEGFDLPSRNTKVTTLHELQHAIQDREGFASGGSVMNYLDDSLKLQDKVQKDLNRLAKQINKKGGVETPADRQKWLALRDQQYAVSPKGQYNRLAGEAEARATEARMNMNMAQRREVFPLDSYDVPIDQLIVRRGLLDGPAMAIDPKAQKKLVQGLLSPGANERYRLGDVTQKQSADAYVFGGSPVGESRNVYASPDILEDHARVSRMAEDNFLANEVGLFSKQAMRPDSDVIPPIKKGDYPLLRSKPALDPVTRKIYNAEMALKPVGDGFEAVTVIPRGLPPRKKPR